MGASTSRVSICNMALSAIGAQSIDSLTEATAEATACNLWYENAREQALEAFNWSFARKRKLLATHSEDPPDGAWAYRYQYPADCVSARQIENISDTADAIPFQIETDTDGDTKTILTDQDEAVLIFTRNLGNTTLFSQLFVQALSSLIAHRIAWGLTGKQKVVDKQMEMYSGSLLSAPAADANERVDKQPREADWIRAREV